MARTYILEKKGADYRIIEAGDFLARAVVHFRDDREMTPVALISEVRRKKKQIGYEQLSLEEKKIVFCIPLIS